MDALRCVLLFVSFVAVGLLVNKATGCASLCDDPEPALPFVSGVYEVRVTPEQSPFGSDDGSIELIFEEGVLRVLHDDGSETVWRAEGREQIY